VEIGRLRPALDDGVVCHQPLAHGGQRQVDLGVHEADVQIRARLHLDHRRLTMVEVRRRKAEPPPVFVHDLRRGARAGKEAHVEVRELGHECAADDHAGRSPGNGMPGHVQDVLPVEREECVRRGAGALRPRPSGRPRGGEPFATQGAPDAAGRDGHHHRQDGEERDTDGDGDEQP
jgi:hypothetical protein